MKRVIFNFLVVIAAYVVSVSDSLAAGFGGVSIGLGTGGDQIGFALCEVVGWLSGPIGAAIASFAVIFLGIGAFFGKVTWGTAVITSVAVFTIFGADAIIPAITGGWGFGCF